MGTVLTNPWDLNFGLLAKRAETFEAGANLTRTFTKRSTLATNCDVSAMQGEFHVVKEVLENPNPNAYANRRGCQDENFPEPTRGGSTGICANCTVQDCLPRYFIYYTTPNQNFPSNPSYLFPVNDQPGRAVLDADGISYTHRQGSNSSHSYYDDESDAEAVRDALVEHWNSMRAPSGCSDQNSLNYSPAAATGPCPCDSKEPNFPDERYLGSSTGTWPAQTEHTTTYTNINRPGDCSCIPKPTDNSGYVMEEWSYQGLRACGFSGVKPSYCYGGLANSQMATEFWGWEEPQGTGKNSNRKQDGSFTYAPGDPAPVWTYTIEDKSLSVCPEGYKCSSLEDQEFFAWMYTNDARKFKATTCGGNCEKMGCMDEKAINYDPDAEIQPSQPSRPNVDIYASLISENDKQRITQYEQELSLWKKYDCIYCDGDNESGKYDSAKGHCECVSGYSWINGKCQKSGQAQGQQPDEPKSPMSLTVVMGIIVAVSLVGMATVASLNKGSE